MATIDLPVLLRRIGDDLEESVKNIAADATLPDDIRKKALGWAAGAAANLVVAGIAKTKNDGDGYDAALREIHLFRKAAEAVATGEALLGLAAAEAEGRKRLAEAIDLGVSAGMKVLVMALV